jgi:hypothetical protein
MILFWVSRASVTRQFPKLASARLLAAAVGKVVIVIREVVPNVDKTVCKRAEFHTS